MKRSLALAAILVLGTCAVSQVHAHATIVLGTFTTTPDPPQVGVPAVINIHLEDPTLTPVEDALVFVDLPRPDSDEPLELRLDELSDPPGSYQASWTPSAEGEQAVSVRDRTFRQEEAVADVTIQVGRGLEPNGEVPFLLPPTPTAPRSMLTWLGWLIGVPLLVGVVVTVLVLRSGGKEDGEEEGSPS